MSEKSSRVMFGSGMAAILVTAGSSVGLGNIWRFPYLVGEGGGAAFIIIYLLAVLIIGHPIMLAEFIVGSTSRKNIVNAYGEQNRKWRFLGYNGVLAAYFIASFYFVVAGWTLKYVISSFSGSLEHITEASEYTAHFNDYVSGVWEPIVYTLIFIIINHVVIAMGVEKGIERFSKIMMPLLFLLLIIMAITSLMMPGSIEGLRYLFVPDFSKVTTRVVLDAIGQVFFSLSLGLGCLTTYATYFRDEADLRKTAKQLTFIDTGVALLASVIVLPAVFSVGLEPSSGPSLVFITLPSIFNTLPFSSLVSGIFFVLLFIAALTSTISMYEIMVLYLMEAHKMSRKKAVLVTSAVVSFTAILASLSFGLLAEFTIFGLPLFSLLDTITANIMLPLGGMLISIYVSWVLEHSVVKRAMNYRAQGRDWFVDINVLLLRYVCPSAIFVIFLDGIGVLKMFY